MTDTLKYLATVNETCVATGLGRSRIYELIRDKKLETVRSGRRRLVVVASIKDFVESLRAAA